MPFQATGSGGMVSTSTRTTRARDSKGAAQPMGERKRPMMTAAELDALCREDIEEAKARIECYEERVAIQRETVDDSKTTTERAVDALRHPERFFGEHQVAQVWLRQHRPMVSF